MVLQIENFFTQQSAWRSKFDSRGSEFANNNVHDPNSEMPNASPTQVDINEIVFSDHFNDLCWDHPVAGTPVETQVAPPAN
jgi:hypothetical protein